MLAISVRWLGHASFQIKSNGKNIYIDPYEGTYVEKADLILVTHSHFDHCDPSKIDKVRKDDTTIIAPADCASKIKGKIKSLKPGEKTAVGNIAVEAVYAYNYKRFRSPGNPFHPKSLGVGYIIRIGDKTIYHAGDTDFVPEMKELGNISLALLPSGGTYTMDNLEAAEAALAINPQIAVPMHRWTTNPEDFRKEIERRSAVKVVVLGPGEEYML